MKSLIERKMGRYSRYLSNKFPDWIMEICYSEYHSGGLVLCAGRYDTLCDICIYAQDDNVWIFEVETDDGSEFFDTLEEAISFYEIMQ